MNLIILSSIPSFVFAMIIVEAVIMVLLGGFLIYDIVRSKLKARKKAKETNEAKRIAAAEKSISLDTSDEDAILASGVSELEYLRRMNKEQKEYIALLEKKMNLKKEIESTEAISLNTMEYNEGEASDDAEFDEFWNSIPAKNGIVLQEIPSAIEETESIEEDSMEDSDAEEEPIAEEAKAEEEAFVEEIEEPLEEFTEEAIAIEEDSVEPIAEEAKVEEETSVEEEKTKSNKPIDNEPKGVVITASSFKALDVNPEEKKKQQEKILAFLKEQEELEVKETKEEIKDDKVYDLVDPWYCQAKPFVKKKKKYNNF